MRNKDDWRRRARTARPSLVVEHGVHLDGLLAFLRSAEVGEGWIVGYSAMADEVDLAPVATADSVGRYALTRTPADGVALSVHPADGPMERHRYGFDQPTADAPVVGDDEIAAVLVPGLAFDRNGGRLGRGAGYYDRFLARLGPAVPRIGITGGYIVAELPLDEHDVTMTHLLGDFGVAPVPLDPERLDANG
ncbi:MAG: 5-formyltetrahydrofolate cyclo-ligase [Actinomycetota bacterium]